VPVGDLRAEWIMVGWGARTFYTTVGTDTDIGLAATWKGIRGDGSVLRVEALGPVRNDEVQWVSLTEAELAALLASIEADFAPDRGPLPIASLRGAFFASSGRFHLFRTCTVWVGEKLRAAGLPFGRWTPTTYAVRLAIWHFDLEDGQ
jgi:hypothetical protein